MLFGPEEDGQRVGRQLEANASNLRERALEIALRQLRDTGNLQEARFIEKIADFGNQRLADKRAVLSQYLGVIRDIVAPNCTCSVLVEGGIGLGSRLQSVVEVTDFAHGSPHGFDGLLGTCFDTVISVAGGISNEITPVAPTTIQLQIPDYA